MGPERWLRGYEHLPNREELNWFPAPAWLGLEQSITSTHRRCGTLYWCLWVSAYTPRTYHYQN